MNVSFSINQYDSDGDITETCILIHAIQNNFIIQLKDMEDLKDLIEQLEKIKHEIETNY